MKRHHFFYIFLFCLILMINFSIKNRYFSQELRAIDSKESVRMSECRKYLQSFPHKKVNLINSLLRISLIFNCKKLA